MSETKEDPDYLIRPEEEKEGNVVDSADFIFRKIGDSIPLKSLHAEFALENAPSQALAVSERFRVLLFAHSGGFCVVNTKDAIDLAKQIKENGKKSSLQEISVVDVSIGQVSLLALSTASSTIAACVGGDTYFFSVASLLNKVQELSSSCSVGESSHVKDLRWRKDAENSYVVLSSHGKLYLGELGGPLMDVMDNVDAVDWSVRGDHIVVAKDVMLRFFSAEFKVRAKMSLLFESWIGDADPTSTIRVDSIKWVRHDTIVIGCVRLTEDGYEEGYLVQVITDNKGEFTKASCNPVVLSFTELFAYVVDDIVPATGPFLLMCYLERWELALAANRKNTDQHIVSLGWSLGDSEGVAAVVEFRQDKDLPRIELPESGDDNLIVGLGVDKVSIYEQIELVRSTEERKELSPYCILMCLTSNGKLIMFHVARITDTSEPQQVLSVPKSDTPATVSLGGTLSKIASGTSKHEVEAVVIDGQSRHIDEVVVQKNKADIVPKSLVQVTEKNEVTSSPFLPSSNLGKITVKSPVINQFGSEKESQAPAWTGKAQTNLSTFNQPFSIVIPKSDGVSNGSAGATWSSSFQNASSGSQSSGNLSLGDGFSLKASNSISSGPAKGETVAVKQSTNQDVIKNQMGKGSSGISGMSSFQGASSGSQSSGNLLFSNTYSSKISSFASSASAFGFGHKSASLPTEGHSFQSIVPSASQALGSKEPVSSTTASILSSSRTTQGEQRRISSAELQKADSVPTAHTSVIAKAQGSKGNVMVTHQKTHLSTHEPELSKSFHNVNDMVKELDILLAHIEEEGGFRDACTLFLESSVLQSEEGLEMLSERCRTWKDKMAEQAQDIQRLLDNTLQLLARKIYVEGLLKQASDKQYWELWNRQKLNPEFEMKQRQINSVHQTLVNQLIELERHFNMLEFKRFGDSERVTMGRRTSSRGLNSSREVESFHSLHSTVKSQLSIAEQLSECLSRQMAMLKIESPPLKRKNVAKELFESIGLAYDVAESFISPVAKRTSNAPESVQNTMASSFTNMKEPSRRNPLSALKGTEPETSRRRRDSLDMSWTSFEPQKTTVKRLLLEKQPLGWEDTPSFRNKHDIFNEHIEEGSDVGHAMDQNKTRCSSVSLSAKKELNLHHESKERMNLNPPVQASESSSPSLFKWAKDHSGAPQSGSPKSSPLQDVQRLQLQTSSLGRSGLINTREQSHFSGRLNTESPHVGQSNPSTLQAAAISQAKSQVKSESSVNQTLIRTISTTSPSRTLMPENAPDEKPYTTEISNTKIKESLQMSAFASASGVPVIDSSTESSMSLSLSKLSESNVLASSTAPIPTQSFEASLSSSKTTKDANQKMPTLISSSSSFSFSKVSSSLVSPLPFLSSSTPSISSSLSNSLSLSPLPESATLSSSTASMSSNFCQESLTTFKTTKDTNQRSPTLTSLTPSILSSKVGCSSVSSTPFPFSTQPLSSTLSFSSSSSSPSSPSVIESQVSTLSPSDMLHPGNVELGGSSENKAPLKPFSESAPSPASTSTVFTSSSTISSSRQLELGSEHKQTSSGANSTDALAGNLSGCTTSSVTTTSGLIMLGIASNASSHTQPGTTSAVEVLLQTSPSNTLADLKNDTSDVAISQEDEMEEEASEISTGLNLGAFGGFGLGVVPASSGPKPNPFGGSFSTASSSPATSFSLTVPSGELFRPASFSFPSLSPPQPSLSPNQGGFSGGFGSSTSGQPGASGFGQPAQIGAGQQDLGSVLGAFGQSRQLGPGLPAVGFASSSGIGGGFAKAGTGGGFAAAAAGGGGFAAAAAPTAGGFAAFGSNLGGGGLSSFNAGNNMAAGKPSELFTQMRR
ncbi:nuclear pore complex protein NUP214 [Aristolochia californica]|uniref:nuclear pore complex protein NUP214 n=1 Tax=Aristolochia californica TaxID=171875 RepID=UPI0035DCB8FE